MPSPLFSGPTSLRHPRERLAIVFTLIIALPIAFLIGKVLHETIGLPEVALFAVIAMLYVTFARGRLIGSSVMIHESQYPRVFALVRKTCAALEIPMPLIFIREDNNVPAVAMGFGEPYSLILSSHWIESFEDDELAFVIGRQLGHIAAGHTRYLSLLSINGNENPIVALVFGAWLRICDYTCDQVGLLVCGSLDAATRAIAVSTFHHFGRKINVAQFAEQGSEIAGDPVLRIGEWMGAEPYATNRIAAMRRFEASARYRTLEDWFLREVPPDPPPLPRVGMMHVSRADCAGWWRRAVAAAIDVMVVGSIVTALAGSPSSAGIVKVTTDATPAPAGIRVNTVKPHPTKPKTNTNDDDNNDDSSDDSSDSSDVNGGDIWHAGPIHLGYNGFRFESGNEFIDATGSYFGSFILVALYLAILVGLVGQSLGMMITGLRVVTTDFRPPGIWRSVWRYAVGMCLWPLIVGASPIMRKLMLHDRLSGTRLITSERILAHSASSVAPAGQSPSA